MKMPFNKWNPFSLFRIENGIVVCALVPTFFGGDSQPSTTTSTVTQSSVPDWLRPQTEALLGGATSQIFQTDKSGNIIGTNPYVPYSSNAADYVAGFSPMQQQAFAQAANTQMPTQFAQGSNLSNVAGLGALQSANNAQGYGSMGAQAGAAAGSLGTNAATSAMGNAGNLMNTATNYGAQGANYGSQAAAIGQMALQAQQTGNQIGAQAQNYAAQSANAGQNLQNNLTNPNNVQAYMNPYLQASLEPQLALLNQQYGKQDAAIKAAASQAGAYGGGRQAVEQSLNRQAEDLAKQQMISQGYTSGFNNAQQQMNNVAGMNIQGLQGANQSLNTALQGGNLGLSGIGQAISGQQAGMQGAGVGLTGIGQATNAGQYGLQGVGQGLAGLNTNIQGANLGLQGVQGAQVGYGLANTTAGTLGNLGANQLAAQQSLINQQNTLGTQQQTQQQNIINAAVNNYANAQNYPMQQLSSYNSLLRGYATPTTASTTYAPAPSTLSQIGGLGATALGAAGAAGAFKKKGGVITEPKYAGGGLVELAMSKAMEGKK